MKHILFYSSTILHPEIGGVERVADTLITGLLRYGFIIDILYLNESGNSQRDDIKYYRMPIRQPYNSPENVQFIKKILQAEKYDIIINLQGVNSGYSLVLLDGNKETCIPIISVLHNTLNYFLWNIPLINKLIRTRFWSAFFDEVIKLFVKIKIFNGLKRVYTESSKIITLSPCYVEQYAKLISHGRTDKLLSILNPSPYEKLYDCNFDDKKNWLLYVGRLSEQKNLFSLLRIWAKIDNNDWTLKIVGDGPQKVELEKYCKHHNIVDVEFVGATDPTPYYKLSKIFLLASFYEGYPMTLIECQQFGCIPICFNSFLAANDIIQDNFNGYLIKPFDESKYAQVVSELLKDRRQLEMMSKNNIYLSKRYNSSKIIEKWNEVINEIISL